MNVSQASTYPKMLCQKPRVGKVKGKLAWVKSSEVIVVLVPEIDLPHVEVFHGGSNGLFVADFVKAGKVKNRHIVDNLAKPGGVGRRYAIAFFDERKLAG